MGLLLPVVVVAAVVFLLLLLKCFKSKPPVFVEVRFDTEGKMRSDTAVHLRGLNRSVDSVTLSSFGFLLPDGEKFVFRHHPRSVSFPLELGTGESCDLWISAMELARELKQRGFAGKVRIVGFFTGEDGRTYRSRTVSFDTDYWAKLTFLFG